MDGTLGDLHVVYVNRTVRTRIGDKVEFILHNYRMPYRSSVENTTTAAKELVHVLMKPASEELFYTMGINRWRRYTS